MKLKWRRRGINQFHYITRIVCMQNKDVQNKTWLKMKRCWYLHLIIRYEIYLFVFIIPYKDILQKHAVRRLLLVMILFRDTFL